MGVREEENCEEGNEDRLGRGREIDQMIVREDRSEEERIVSGKE